jgi:4-hydroxythreonine-4-phosphate dehydrogenase
MDSRMMQVCTPIVYGSSKVASYHRKALNINDFSFNIIRDADQTNNKLANMINCWEEEVKIDIGQSTEIAGKMAFKALEQATNDLKNKKIDALVTAPINKNNIQSANFTFAGHTEYLAQQFGTQNYIMLLVSGDLRIGTVTGHIPLSKVSEQITEQKIIDKTKTLMSSLISDFGIRKPKIAVLGLNPHAGDNGLLGKEETETIIPAIKKLKENGFVVNGPYAADGFFGSLTYKNYDGILAMYHDQGLIPFKQFAFENGVNFTAGLPAVRTSPDHGTGYDIAGKNIANESSFREAIYVACDIVRQRRENEINSANPLKITHLKRDR